MAHYRSVLLRLMPTPLRGAARALWVFWRLLPNAVYDFQRYWRFSGANFSHRQGGELQARVAMSCHQIEKGLSLREPRPGFGRPVIARLVDLTGRLPDDADSRYLRHVVASTLEAYVAFNSVHGVDVEDVKAQAAAILRRAGDAETIPAPAGGVRTVRRDELRAAVGIDFRRFFESRHSVRHFAHGAIPRQTIVDAVMISQKSPSVCNRQAWHVHVFDDPIRRAELLSLQAGARGFGDQCGAVLVVTCDQTWFVNVGERYQAWIDGGMFSMSLCLALHAAGLGSCCLNWSKEWRDDLRFRRAADLLDGEQVIMLIAVGHLPERFEVAWSGRPDVQRMLRFH